MCRSKNEGGRRCSSCLDKRRLNIRKTLQAAIVDHKIVIDEIDDAPYNVNTKALQRKADRLAESIAAQKLELEKVEERFMGSQLGRKLLLARAADESLSPADRAKAQFLAETYDSNHVNKLDGLRRRKQREALLEKQLAKAGVDPETVQEIMSMDDNSSFASAVAVVSSPVAKKRMYSAIANSTELLTEAKESVAKASTPAEREALTAEYSTKLAEAKGREAAAYAVYSLTPAGLKEAKDKAADAKTAEAKAYLRGKVANLESLRKKNLEQNNLRRNRENAIRSSLENAGASDSHIDKVISEHRKARKSILDAVEQKPETKMMSKVWAALTATEAETLAADAKKQGVTPTVLLRRRALELPTKNYGSSLEEVQATAEIFKDGGSHRQRTTEHAKRNVQSGSKLDAREKSIIEARAKTFHMSTSSYVRAMILERDVRQIQNDRSVAVNNVKAQAMATEHPDAKATADLLSA